LLRPNFRPFLNYITAELSSPSVAPLQEESWVDHHRRLIQTGHLQPAEASYDVGHWLLNTADFGVPQIRHRVIFIGIRRDLGLKPSPPPATHSGEALRRAMIRGEYWERHGIPVPEEIDLRRVRGGDPLLAPWQTVRDAIADLPEPLEKSETPGYRHHVGWPGARIYKGHTPNPLDLPSKTIKAGVHGVPGGEHILLKDDGSIRYYTVRETARIMTFPDSWTFSGARGEQMRQLGNAVPVEFAAAVASHLRRELEKPAAIATTRPRCQEFAPTPLEGLEAV
jgi:DNA (cytosine-5)-methyltransferase 1